MDKLSIINRQIEELTEELNYHVDLNIRHEDLLDKLAAQKALYQHYQQNHQRLMVVAEMYEMVLCSPGLAETHFYEQYVMHITKYQNQVIQPASVELPYHKFIEKPKTRNLHQLRPIAELQAKYRHACRKLIQRIKYTPSRTEAEAHIRLEILRSRTEFVSPIISKFASQVSRLEQRVKRLEEKVKILRAKVDSREGEKILRAFVAEYQVMAAKAFNDLKQQHIMDSIPQHPETPKDESTLLTEKQRDRIKQCFYRSMRESRPDSCSSFSSTTFSVSTRATSNCTTFETDDIVLNRKVPFYYL